MSQQKRYPANRPIKTGNLSTENSTKIVSTPSGLTVHRIREITLFVLAVALYINTISFDYTLDDKLYITKNEYTKKGLAGIPDILSNDLLTGFYGIKKDLVAGGRYRPLSLVTYAIEWEIFGENPYMSHFVNIILYAFTGVLLFNILSRLLKGFILSLPGLIIFQKDKPGNLKSFFPNLPSYIFHFPFLATALFLAHPLHTEVVANIKGRDDIMCLLGSLGALYFVLRWLEEDKTKPPPIGGWRASDPLFLLFACIFLFLGILTKETAVTFVAIIPVTAYFFTNQSLKKILISTVPLVITVGAYILLRYIVLGPPGKGTVGELMNNPFAGVALPEKLATIFYTCGLYLKLLLFPHPLTHDYYPKQIPIIGWSDLRAIIPLLLYTVLAIFALSGVMKKHLLSYCFWLFLFSFSIASNFIFNVGAFMNERFMYIPSIGFALFSAWLLLSGIPRLLKSRTFPVALVFVLFFSILIAYSVKTISRNFVWKDDFTLATTDVKTSANSAKCNMSAGGNLVEKAEKEENAARKDSMLTAAIVYLDKATTLHPTYNDAWLLKGNGYAMRENWNSSIICYENVLKISPMHEHANKNLQYVANKTIEKQQYEFTLMAYNTLLKYQPGNGDYLKKMGTFHGKNLGQVDKAIEYLKKSNAANPNDGYALQELGVAHGILGKHKDAIDYFLKAKEFLPDNGQLYMNISLTMHFLGDTVSERQYREKAVQLDGSLKR